MKNLTIMKLNEISAEYPLAHGILHNYGFDACCGGAQTLADACAGKGIAPETVAEEIRQTAEHAAPGEARDSMPVPDLVRHIMDTHHDYLHQAMPQIAEFSDRVARVHGDSHPEVVEINKIFKNLRSELDEHLIKEEQILFPMIIDLCAAVQNNTGWNAGHCGSVSNPIRVMNYEHDSATAMLKRIRELSSDFTPPPGACNSYRFLYEKLKEFEADLIEHMRIETNALFNRVEDLEHQKN